MVCPSRYLGFATHDRYDSGYLADAEKPYWPANVVAAVEVSATNKYARIELLEQAADSRK